MQPSDLMSDFERIAKRRMLKWHAGYTMFCPICQTILDARRAVEIDVYKQASDDTGAPANGDLVTSKIFCAKCWDKRADQVQARFAAAGLNIDLTDGRELFRAPARAAKQASKQPKGQTNV